MIRCLSGDKTEKCWPIGTLRFLSGTRFFLDLELDKFPKLSGFSYSFPGRQVYPAQFTRLTQTVPSGSAGSATHAEVGSRFPEACRDVGPDGQY